MDPTYLSLACPDLFDAFEASVSPSAPDYVQCIATGFQDTGNSDASWRRPYRLPILHIRVPHFDTPESDPTPCAQIAGCPRIDE
jgi:hypothetical protein